MVNGQDFYDLAKGGWWREGTLEAVVAGDYVQMPWGQTPWVQTVARPLKSCVTPGYLLNLSVPQFPIWKMGTMIVAPETVTRINT